MRFYPGVSEPLDLTVERWTKLIGLIGPIRCLEEGDLKNEVWRNYKANRGN